MFVNKLRHLRGAGESYSDVILRLADERLSHVAVGNALKAGA